MNVIFYLDSCGKIKNHKPKKPLGLALINSDNNIYICANDSNVEKIIITHLEKIGFLEARKYD